MAWQAAAMMGMQGGQAMGDYMMAGLGKAFSARQARKQRRWAESMYRHRYQWAVEDLEKAGINPLFAVGGSMAGAAPGGATAATPSFRQTKMDAAALGRLNAEIANIKAATAKQVSESKYIDRREVTEAHNARTAYWNSLGAEHQMWQNYALSDKFWNDALISRQILQQETAKAIKEWASTPRAEQIEKIYKDSPFLTKLQAIFGTWKSPRAQ